MNDRDPLQQTLLDLHAVLGAALPLIVGGGYGLFLKQEEIRRTRARTFYPMELLPENRTTNDIDLFLRAEVVVSAEGMKSVREALDTLGFQPIAGNEYLQFRTSRTSGVEIKIDLMVGPLGELFDPKTMKRDDRRVRPKAFKDLHAHPMEEAVGVEEHLSPIALSGVRRGGAKHQAIVYVPQPFTYLLMKLLAFRDRAQDERKDLARHHALDIYRIIGLITQVEDQLVRDMARRHMTHPKVLEARAVAASSFGRIDALGTLRMREHPLSTPNMMIESFIAELATVLPPLAT